MNAATIAAAHDHRQASVRNLPVNLFASVMGISGLALAWRMAHRYVGFAGWIAEAASALAVGVFIVLAAAYTFKALRYRAAVAAEFNHPILGNFFGTIVISVLLLSAIVQPYAQGLSRVLWSVGTVATFALAFVVVSRLLRGRGDPANTVPAWLIPGVATLDIAVTGADMPLAWAPEANLAALAVGAVVALLLYATIFSRLVHHEPLPRGMTPSLMVLVAPFAVGFLAYTNLMGGVDRFASLLFYFGLFMFLLLAPRVFRRDVPFSPGWWAISFPMAALASAALKYAAAHDALVLHALALTLLAALTLAIAVLAVRTLHIAFSGRLLSA
jgi:tellurite resistance protein